MTPTTAILAGAHTILEALNAAAYRAETPEDAKRYSELANIIRAELLGNQPSQPLTRSQP